MQEHMVAIVIIFSMIATATYNIAEQEALDKEILAV